MPDNDDYDYSDYKDSEPEQELAKAWMIHQPSEEAEGEARSGFQLAGRKRRDEDTKKWTLGPKPSFVRNKVQECSVRYINTCEALFDQAWMAECRKYSDITSMIEVSY